MKRPPIPTAGEVSRIVRRLREVTGLTQQELAEMIGVAFATINRWENGHHRPHPLMWMGFLRWQKEIKREFKRDKSKEASS